MRTKEEIEQELKRCKDDYRYPEDEQETATVRENAPLALEQQAMQARVQALRWVLQENQDKGGS